MRFLIGLILGIAIGFGAFWMMRDTGRFGAGEPAAEDADRFGDWRERMDWRADEIQEELSRTGGVIRRRAQEIGAYVADATADTRITGAIKSKLALDDELSAVSISVNTTDGIVTLSGRVNSYDHIGRAIDLAMETEGVREVVSTLQVAARRPDRPPDKTQPPAN